MTTDERFDALEKTVGRQRITITALVLVAVAAAVMAAAPQGRDATFDTITAKELRIENDAGKLQVLLAANKDGGGGLGINNAAGEPQVLLGADKNGGVLVINNAAGKLQALLAADENGGFLDILNKAGERVGQLP